MNIFGDPQFDLKNIGSKNCKQARLFDYDGLVASPDLVQNKPGPDLVQNKPAPYPSSVPFCLQYLQNNRWGYIVPLDNCKIWGCL